MLGVLAEYFPPECGVTWTHPAGGSFLWLCLPPVTMRANFWKPPSEKTWPPLRRFLFAQSEKRNRYCRLNFSNAQPEMMREGIHRLSNVVKANGQKGAEASALANHRNAKAG